MNEIFSVAPPLTSAISDAENYAVRGIKWIGSLSDHIQTNRSITILTFFAANAILFPLMHLITEQIGKAIDQWQGGKEAPQLNKVMKHILIDGILFGGSVLAANLALSKLTKLELSYSILAAIAAVAVRALYVMVSDYPTAIVSKKVDTEPATKKVEVEAAVKTAEEEKIAQEALIKKKGDEEAAAAKKAEEDAQAAKAEAQKKADEEAAKKVQEEKAAQAAAKLAEKKAAKEALAKKEAQEAAAATKKLEEEKAAAAIRQAEEEMAAAAKKAEELEKAAKAEAQKKGDEEASKKAQEAKAAAQAAEKLADMKAAKEALAKKETQEAAAASKKAAEEKAAAEAAAKIAAEEKAAQEAQAKKKADEEAAAAKKAAEGKAAAEAASVAKKPEASLIRSATSPAMAKAAPTPAITRSATISVIAFDDRFPVPFETLKKLGLDQIDQREAIKKRVDQALRNGKGIALPAVYKQLEGSIKSREHLKQLLDEAKILAHQMAVNDHGTDKINPKDYKECIVPNLDVLLRDLFKNQKFPDNPFA